MTWVTTSLDRTLSHKITCHAMTKMPRLNYYRTLHNHSSLQDTCTLSFQFQRCHYSYSLILFMWTVTVIIYLPVMANLSHVSFHVITFDSHVWSSESAIYTQESIKCYPDNFSFLIIFSLLSYCILIDQITAFYVCILGVFISFLSVM